MNKIEQLELNREKLKQTLEEIEKELFEGDTIITGKKDLESMKSLLESTD